MDYEVSDERSRVDHEAVWQFLSTGAYWARWRTRAELETQLEGAWRLVGAYAAGAQVGFARAVSDGVAVAHLADVYVLPAHRGRGLGRRIVQTMLACGVDLTWYLSTVDAHDLYRQVGFRPADATCMVRPRLGDDSRPPLVPDPVVVPADRAWVTGVPVPQLLGGQLCLRPWQAGDIPAVIAASADPGIVEATSLRPSCDTAEALAYVGRQHERHARGEGWSLAIVQDLRCIGHIGLWPEPGPTGRARVGYWLAPDARGHGAARTALLALRDWACAATGGPGLGRLEAYVDPVNIASARTLTGAGFVREGRARAWLGVGGRRRDMDAYAWIPDPAPARPPMT